MSNPRDLMYGVIKSSSRSRKSCSWLLLTILFNTLHTKSGCLSTKQWWHRSLCCTCLNSVGPRRASSRIRRTSRARLTSSLASQSPNICLFPSLDIPPELLRFLPHETVFGGGMTFCRCNALNLIRSTTTVTVVTVTDVLDWVDLQSFHFFIYIAS
uniref:Uncharacterized protein n=1 Tax=Opuntia streptacantha TaxID=393608 RepID=A0A7C9CMK2_OPUST